MKLRRFSIIFAIVFGIGFVAAVFVVKKMRLPKPQIASAAGQPAPDFTLPSGSGEPFHLADQHGKRVLLIFYRGYW